ncbi:MAG TPA: hypothetical protein VFK73_09700, partial [Paludibacter sp.]|nr:hypothetical protein [Paludibacter sp.]
MKFIRVAIISSFIFTLITGSNAQSTFQPGTIITNNNDSIVGLIYSKSETKLFKECKFQPNKTSPITTYTPQMIKAFSINSGT